MRLTEQTAITPERKAEYNFMRNIVNLRKLRGLTQREMAKKVGVNVPRYQSWEEGRAFPCMVHAFRLANFFKYNVQDLFGPEEYLLIQNQPNTIEEKVEVMWQWYMLKYGQKAQASVATGDAKGTER